MFLTNEQLFRARCKQALDMVATAITVFLTVTTLLAIFIYA